MRGFKFAILSVAMASGATCIASAEQQFHGTWVSPSHRTTKCRAIDGEVAGIAIGKDKYVPLLGGFCEDVRTFLHGKRLRVSANCVSDEGGGHSAVVNEFDLVNKNTLRVTQSAEPEMQAGDRFVRCADCKPSDLNCVFGEAEAKK